MADGSTIASMLRGQVQVDVVSGPMLLLVCTLALVVTRYSHTYLRSEGGLERYARSLLLTLAAVTLLVISNHLGVVIAAWLATGIGLQHLLTFYRRRRQAVIVAHKEFLLSRLADLFFFASVYLIDSDVGSLHIDVVNAFVVKRGGLTAGLHLATTLLVIGVLLKSAQLPFHGWMEQVMEALTPGVRAPARRHRQHRRLRDDPAGATDGARAAGAEHAPGSRPVDRDRRLAGDDQAREHQAHPGVVHDRADGFHAGMQCGLGVFGTSRCSTFLAHSCQQGVLLFDHRWRRRRPAKRVAGASPRASLRLHRRSRVGVVVGRRALLLSRSS